MTALFVHNGPRCEHCKDDGKCHTCDGTGINIHINEDEPKCSTCGGSGRCPICKGKWSILTDSSATQNLKSSNSL